MLSGTTAYGRYWSFSNMLKHIVILVNKGMI